jgi:hypothetical protein
MAFADVSQNPVCFPSHINKMIDVRARCRRSPGRSLYFLSAVFSLHHASNPDQMDRRRRGSLQWLFPALIGMHTGSSFF